MARQEKTEVYTAKDIYGKLEGSRWVCIGGGNVGRIALLKGGGILSKLVWEGTDDVIPQDDVSNPFVWARISFNYQW